MSDPDRTPVTPTRTRQLPPPWLWVAILASIVLGIVGQVVPSATLRTVCINAFASLFLALAFVATIVLLIEDRKRLPLAAGWLLLIVFVWFGLGLYNLRAALTDIAQVLAA